MDSHGQTKIAVDVSMLSEGRSGLARYLTELLRECVSFPEGRRQWLLYGRSAAQGEEWLRPNVRFRSDGLPRGLGRVISLFTTQPSWAAIDRPTLYWGPAHRLPWRLPFTTARVVTIHDLCWLDAAETMRRSTRCLDAWLMPRALSMSDQIIAVSKPIGEALRTRFPDTVDRIVVIPEGVSVLPPPEDPEALDRLGVNRPYVLSVGTIEPRKNLSRLLQAFSRVSEPKCAAPQLVIVGAPGWGGMNLTRIIGDMGLADRVKYLGPVSDADLSTLYRHARCLAMPSLYEGFGLPLIEAMRYGTPVLTSRLGSMADIAADSGVLVDPLAVESIEAGLRKLISDDGLCCELGNRAQELATAYSWAQAARETVATIDRAIELRHRLFNRQ